MVKTRQLLLIFLVCALFAARVTLAQTTLTQIRDTVVNADGSPFNGTVVITWNGFTGSNPGTIAPLSTSARVYSGTLSVLLVPTTTASPGTFYQAVYYDTNGVAVWTETWQVPPSGTPLTLSTVRTSASTGSGASTGTGGGSGTTGTGGSGQFATLPISLNQITGLSAILASLNFAISGLNTQLNTIGSTPPTTASFVDSDSLSGTLDGVNATFNLSQTPVPASSLSVFRNGLLQSLGIDYTVSGSAVTFLPASVPLPADLLNAAYRVAAPGPTAIFIDSEIPSGVIDGNNSNFMLQITPNPAGSLKLYKNGVLLVQNTDYALGNNIIVLNTNITPQPGDALLASYRH